IRFIHRYGVHRDFNTTVYETPDVDKREPPDPRPALGIAGRGRQRLLNQEVLTHLIEVGELEAELIVQKAGIESGFDLLPALELQAGISRIQRNGSGRGARALDVGRGLERRERGARSGNA